MTLASFVEQISDDFESTFSVIDSNTLQNMLGHPSDYCDLIDIIRNYIPCAKIEFIKTGQFNKQYDIYIIRLVCSDQKNDTVSSFNPS